MQTERQREAVEFQAQGGQRGQEIRAKADREVTVLLAASTAQGEQVRGDGDGERNREEGLFALQSAVLHRLTNKERSTARAPAPFVPVLDRNPTYGRSAIAA
jgi:regulator of protease activity HflC (stomatin/prohibitin superfamily)